MSLLYRNNLIEEENNNSGYVTPAVLRDDEDVSMKKSIMISTALHSAAPVIIGIVAFILALLGITFTLFDKPTPKLNDIEFVLVDKEETPINK